MKYSSFLGVLFSLGVIVACFLPWVYIDPIQVTVTGVQAPQTSFGKPGVLHITFATISLLLFMVPKVWAKRLNVFVSTLNLAWTLRNFLLVTQCELGECPEKKAGIFLLIGCSVVVFIMSLLPDVEAATVSKPVL